MGEHTGIQQGQAPPSDTPLPHRRTWRIQPVGASEYKIGYSISIYPFKDNEWEAAMSFTLRNIYPSPEHAWTMFHVYHEEFEEDWLKAIARMYQE